MDHRISEDVRAYLSGLDRFIEDEIKPFEAADDEIASFDHQREWTRSDYDRGGLPHRDWEALLREMRRRADAAGHYRHCCPATGADTTARTSARS